MRSNSFETHNMLKCADHQPDHTGIYSLTTFSKWYDFFHKLITNPSLFGQIRRGPILAIQGPFPASQPAS